MSSSGERSSINSRGFVTKPPCISASESTLVPVPETIELPVHQKKNDNLEEDSEEHTSSTSQNLRNQRPFDRRPFPFLQDLVRFTDDMGLRSRGRELEDIVQEIYNSDETKSSSDSSTDDSVYSEEDTVGQYERCKTPDDVGASCITIKSSQLQSTDNNISLLESLRRESTTIFQSDFSSISSIKIDYQFKRDQKHFHSIQNALRCIIKKCLKAPEPSIEIDKYVPYLIMRLTSKVAEGLRKSKSASSLVEKQKTPSDRSLKRPQTSAASSARFNRQDVGHRDFKSTSTQTRPVDACRPINRRNLLATPGHSPIRNSSPGTCNFLNKTITEHKTLRNDVEKQNSAPRRALPNKRSPNRELRSFKNRDDNLTDSAARQIKTPVSPNERPPWRFSAPKSQAVNVVKPVRQPGTFRSPQRRHDLLLTERAQKLKENSAPANRCVGSPTQRIPPRLQNIKTDSTSRTENESIQVIHPPPDSSTHTRKLSTDYKGIIRPNSPNVTRRCQVPALRTRSPEKGRVIMRQNQNEFRNQMCTPKSPPSRSYKNGNEPRERPKSVLADQISPHTPTRRQPEMDFRQARRSDVSRRTITSENRGLKENSRNVVCNSPYEGSCGITQNPNRHGQSNWNSACSRNVKEHDCISNDRSITNGDQALVKEEPATRKPSLPTILIVSGDFISRNNDANYGMKKFNKHEIGDNVFSSYKGS